MQEYSAKSRRFGLRFSKKGRSRSLPYVLALGLCLLPGLGRAVTVSTVDELVDAVDQANAGGDTQIWLEDGTYTLGEALVIRANGVTVRSASGNRNMVTIRGNGMEEGDDVSHIFNVEGDNFTARDMTLRLVYYHAIQMQPQAQAPTMINLHILDTGEQMIKIAYDGINNPSIHSDNGRVENCRFEYSAGIGPQYYIGGVDAHHAFDWVVRGNTFVNIRSPEDPDAGGRVAEHAIHFWNGSRDTLVEKNTIINCDRGIGFGLGSQGHVGGIIRNNMIYHNAAHDLGDVGIGLESVTDAQVYNNTIYQEHAYANAIEYRFPATTGLLIANNLTNKAIDQRDGASAEVSNNVTNANSGWFVNPTAGDLHLATPVPTVVNQGRYIEGLTDDMDGDIRPQGGGYDIGADEYDSCPDCSDIEVVLDSATFATGTICECIAEISITMGTNVLVQTGATVTFTAPIVRLTPGFRVENGAIVHIRQE